MSKRYIFKIGYCKFAEAVRKIKVYYVPYTIQSHTGYIKGSFAPCYNCNIHPKKCPVYASAEDNF